MKTKALISCTVTAICAFVFAYAKSRFSHDVALIIVHVVVAVHDCCPVQSIVSGDLHWKVFLARLN